jgi:hypothetical protein
MSTFTYIDYSPSDLIGATLININTSFRSILELVNEATEIVGKGSVVEGCVFEVVTPGNGAISAGKFITYSGALHTKLFGEVVSFPVVADTSFYVFYDELGELQLSDDQPELSSVFIAKVTIDENNVISVEDLRNTFQIVSGTREIFNGRGAVLALKKKESGMLLEGFLGELKTFSLNAAGDIVANSLKVSVTPIDNKDVVNKEFLDNQLESINTSINGLEASVNQITEDLETNVAQSITNLEENVAESITTLQTSVNTSITSLDAKIKSQSFAQLFAIGDLNFHAENGPIHDFYLNTDSARILRKIAATCPQTSETGAIEFDLLIVSSPGGTATSLFQTKPKPTITCNGGASWIVISENDLDSVNIPDNSLIQLTITASPPDCFDIRVELFE